MDPEEMRGLIRHIMEDGFNQKNLQIIHDSFHENYVRRGYGVRSVGSLTEHIADIEKTHANIIGAKFTIHTLVAEGDIVAVRYTMTGKHTGGFIGVAPTGREFSRESAAFFRIVDGKVAEGDVVSITLNCTTSDLIVQDT